MDAELRGKLLEWIRSEQLPEVEVVRELRRRIAATEQQQLARVLMNTEKALEKNVSDPLKPLRLFFRDGSSRGSKFWLVRDQFEPFPELRLRVLENKIDATGGEITKREEQRVQVQTYNEADTELIKSLYNWKVESDQ